MWSRWAEMDILGEAEAPEESEKPKKSKHPPIADAGGDRVVFDTVVLDGSGSSDPDGSIVAWDWSLRRRDNPADIRYVSGVTATVSGLQSGFYDVTLTVTDDDNLVDTDTMLLAVYARPNVDFKVSDFSIIKNKKSQRTTSSISGTIVGFPTLTFAGPIVNSRITIELADALGEGADLVMSAEVPLNVTNVGETFMLRGTEAKSHL